MSGACDFAGERKRRNSHNRISPIGGEQHKACGSPKDALIGEAQFHDNGPVVGAEVGAGVAVEDGDVGGDEAVVDGDFEEGKQDGAPSGLEAAALASVAEVGGGEEVVKVGREAGGVEIAGEDGGFLLLVNERGQIGELLIA